MAIFGDLVSNIKGLFWEQVNINGYVFDAYLRMQQQTTMTITENPVESGSLISDHAYINPPIFTFEIGMTDTAQGKVFLQFGLLNRSVNAYKLLKEWQDNRERLTLNSKYGFYENILVQDILTNDDYTTYNGMKATVVLKQVLITSTQLVKVSSADFMTSSVNRGVQNVKSATSNTSVISELGSLLK